MNKIFGFILLSTFVVMAIFILTGCVKSEVSVDVNTDGSGLVGIAIGMTQEAKSMLDLQGLGLSTEGGIKGQLEKMMLNQAISTTGVQFDTWTDGDYEWLKMEKEAGSVEEINQLAAQSNLFKSFTLTQKIGFFQNEFNLNAEISPLTAGLPDLGGFQLDTSSMMEVRFALSLPGSVTQTNGTQNPAEPNKMTWVVQGSQPMVVQASSVAWNWLNIGLVMSALAVLMIVLVILAVLVIIKASRKTETPR